MTEWWTTMRMISNDWREFVSEGWIDWREITIETVQIVRDDQWIFYGWSRERERENRNELVFDLTQGEYVDDNVDKWFSSDRILSIVYRIELISKDLFRVHIRMYLHRQVSMSFDFPNYNRAEEYLPKESTIHSAFPNANQCNRSHRHRDVDFVLEQSAMAEHRTWFDKHRIVILANDRWWSKTDQQGLERVLTKMLSIERWDTGSCDSSDNEWRYSSRRDFDNIWKWEQSIDIEEGW